MKAKLKPNTITKQKGYIIECMNEKTHCHFYVDGHLKVFSGDYSIMHKIRAKIASGEVGVNISAIQYNVICNQIKNEYGIK